MAKGKGLNPADTFRKAERRKELKKNKVERQKARDLALVKKDTTTLEKNIEELENAETLSFTQKSELESLKAELARINSKKEEYVAEHPEQRRLVYRGNYKKAEQSEEKVIPITSKQRNVFDQNGLPRHPERSIYYDPVMNPYGVPPPGMPYLERPLRPDEIDSQEEDDDEEGEGTSDEDIVMPIGPPPTLPVNEADDDVNDDDDDDIPMPEGPPPPSQMPPLLSDPPPLPPGPPPSHAFPSPFLTAPPPPQLHLLPPFFLSPEPSVHQMPLFFVPLPRVQSIGSMQDPLLPYPHQAYQAERRHSQLPSNKLMKEIAGPKVSSTAESVEATISAPAELRDLKRESTAFMPSSLKRRKRMEGAVSSKQINAAPEETGAAAEADADTRPDLLDTLRSNLPSSIIKTNDVN